MILLRKYLDADANDNGGGAAATDAPPADQQTNLPADLPQPAFTIDELKEFGIENKESLIAQLKELKEKNRPDEEVKKQAALERVNFQKYAVERGFATDDFNKYESLSSKAERDLVFEQFAAEEKADNPDITDQELKEAFETEYKLNSDNEKARAKGEARLKKDAAEIKKPAETAWKTAQDSYNEEKAAYVKQKEFKSIIKNTFEKEIPGKFTFKGKDGDEDIVLEVDVTPELRSKIEKSYDSDKTFVKFLTHNGKPEEFAASISSKIKSHIKAELSDMAVQKAIEAGIGRGTKKGSTVGAENPYALKNNGGGNQSEKKESLEQSNNKLANVRKQFAHR